MSDVGGRSSGGQAGKRVTTIDGRLLGGSTLLAGVGH